MKKIIKLTTLVATAWLGAVVYGQADNMNATGNDNNPVAHPINAYTNHEVKEDMKDSQEYSQKAAEAKAAYEQAKHDYETSVKDNGHNSAVTKDAKKRMTKEHDEMHKYEKKATQANHELKKDEIKAHQ